MKGLRIKWLVLAFIFQTRVSVTLSLCQRPMPEVCFGHCLVRTGPGGEGGREGMHGGCVLRVARKLNEEEFSVLPL